MSSESSNAASSTIIVGDMHLKQHYILPAVDAALERFGASRVVFCGDYCDDWGARNSFALLAVESFVRWCTEKRATGVRVDVLLGNHDLRYLDGKPGTGTQASIIPYMRRHLQQLELSAATVVQGRLVTHAGVTRRWADLYLDMSKIQRAQAQAETTTVASKPNHSADSAAPQASSAPHTPLTPRSAAVAHEVAMQLNQLFEDRDAWRYLDTCGRARGGWYEPSPLWADTSELAFDPFPGLSQIVGHTPQRTCRRIDIAWRIVKRAWGEAGIIQTGSSDETDSHGAVADEPAVPEHESRLLTATDIWACDTFSLTSMLSPVGDGSMLMVDERGGVNIIHFEDVMGYTWDDYAALYDAER